MGILPSDENIQDQTEFEVLFKNGFLFLNVPK